MIYLLASLGFGALFFMLKTYLQLNSFYLIAFSLGFLILISFFTGKFFSKIGLPAITGYLITGLILSPYLTGGVPVYVLKATKFIEEIAIVFIAFQSGMEIELKFLKQYGKEVIRLTMLIALFAFAGIFATSLFLLKKFPGNVLNTSIILGILLILKSPLSTIAIIKESNTNTLFGEKILGIAVFKDVLVVTLFAIIVPLLTSGNSSAKLIVYGLIGSVVFGILLGFLISLYMKHIKAEAHVLIFLLALFITELSYIHLDPLIISVIVGFFIKNFTVYDNEFSKILNTFSPILYLLFFTLADSGIDIRNLIPLIPVSLLFIAVKWVFTMLGISLGTKDVSLRKYGAIGLLNQSGLSLALIVLAEAAFPVEGPIIKGIVITVIVLTDIFAPALFKKVLVKVSTEEAS